MSTATLIPSLVIGLGLSWHAFQTCTDARRDMALVLLGLVLAWLGLMAKQYIFGSKEDGSVGIGKPKMIDTYADGDYPIDTNTFVELAQETAIFLSKYKQDLKDGKYCVSAECKNNLKRGFIVKLFGSDNNGNIDIDKLNSFPENGFKNSNDFYALLKEIKEKILPNMLHWESPNFFAFVKTTFTLYHNILGSMLESGLGTVGFTWMSNPISCELEMMVCNWYANLLHLPKCFMWKFMENDDKMNMGTGQRHMGGGCIVRSASETVYVTMLAAKTRCLHELNMENNGKNGQIEEMDIMKRLSVYCSDQTHFSVAKACKIIGIPLSNLKYIKADASTRYELDYDRLKKQMINDIVKDNLIPFYCMIVLGTTSSGAVDPILPTVNILNDIKKELKNDDASKYLLPNNIWFHIDGAYGLSHCVLPEYSWMIKGIENVDSVNTNGHKMLLNSMYTAFLFFKDRRFIEMSLTLSRRLEEYVQNINADSGDMSGTSFAVFEPKDVQLPLAKAWPSIRAFVAAKLMGRKGFVKNIENHIRLGKEFRNLVNNKSKGQLETKNDFNPLGFVCFKAKNKTNDFNQTLLQNINKTGEIFLTHTKLDDEFVLRFTAGGIEYPKTSDVIIHAFEIIMDQLHKLE